MSYQPNIPQPNQLLSLSQVDILTNFNQLNSVFGNVDHVAYSPPITNSGKHNKSTYVQQASDPATAALEGAVYTKDIGGVPTLVYRQQLSGTVSPILIGSSTAANPGSVNIGGIIIKWGGNVSLTSNTEVVNFVSAFPNNCFSVVVTSQNSSQAAGSNTFTTSGFTCTHSGGANLSVSYVAIGN